MARERRQRRANLSDLIAAKDYAQAIEVLREQLSQRPPGVQRRLQLADLLLLAGRRGEALPILESIADELMKDGFAAKAVAILKRIDRLDPGRPDVEARLAQLAQRPQRAPVATPAPPVESSILAPSDVAAAPGDAPEAWADDDPKPAQAPSPSEEPTGDKAEDKNEAKAEDKNEAKAEGESEHKAEAPAAEAAIEPPPSPTEVPPNDEAKADDEAKAKEAQPKDSKLEEAKAEDAKPPAAASAEDGGFTGMLKRLFTRLPRKTDEASPETPAVEKKEAATEEKPEAPATAESATAESTTTESPAPEGTVSETPAVEAGAAAAAPSIETATAEAPPSENPPAAVESVSTEPVSAEQPVPEETVAGAETPAPATEALAETPSEEPSEKAPAASDEEPVANVILDTAPAEAAEQASAPPPAEAADAGGPAPNVVEKLGGVFKKFLAALPGASEEGDLDSEVAAREFVAALAASGLDQDDDEGEFIAAFIDEDPASPPSEDDDAPGDDATAAAPDAESGSSPEPVSSPSATAPALPRAASGTPITEADFRDQVLDLLEQVLKQPADAVESLVATTENTEPLAAAYRDTLLVHPLFSDLSPSEMLAVLRALRLVFMEPGDIVVTEGEPGASLFLIISGDVRLFVRNPAGHNVEVGRLTEGAFFGEMSLLSGKPRNATVTAASRLEMLELPKAMLDGIAQAHPRVRDIVDALYLQRASSPEVAAVRSVPTGTEDTRERAREVLRSYFGGRRFEPRMQLKLATVLLKAGKYDEAVPVLVTLANELLREGDTPKAIAILKKVERIRTRSLEEMNLAPLPREDEAAKPPAPPLAPEPAEGEEPAPEARTEAFFAAWLSDTVRRAKVEAHTAPSRQVPGYTPDLLATPLFEGFSEEELLAFMQGLRLLAFEPGEVILTEGESGESVLILAAGSVKVSVRDPHGRSVVLCELREGAFFGEISALSGRPRSATVTAAWNCELLELDRAALDGIATTHPRVRQVLEEAYIERAGSAEAARIRTAGRVQPEA